MRTTLAIATMLGALTLNTTADAAQKASVLLGPRTIPLRRPTSQKGRFARLALSTPTLQASTRATRVGRARPFPEAALAGAADLSTVVAHAAARESNSGVTCDSNGLSKTATPAFQQEVVSRIVTEAESQQSTNG